MAAILALAPSFETLVARARDRGVDPSERMGALVDRLARAMKQVLGAPLATEVSFDEASGTIAAMACVKVGRGPGEASPEQVAAVLGAGFEEGDEVLVDVGAPYDSATWSLLGLPDPERVHAVWAAESGAARLEAFPEAHASMPDLVAELGERLEVPPLEWSIAVIARLLAEHAPAARAYYAGASSEDVRYFRELGDATGELVLLLEKLGPSGSGDEPPFHGGHPLLTAERARAVRAMLDGLEADGDFGRWEANEWWNPSWVPFLGDDVSLRSIDLSGWGGGVPGQIVGWASDAPERPVDAPSVRDWLGLIALGVLAGILVWDDAWGIHEPFTPRSAFDALRTRVLPGYPKQLCARERSS